MKDLNLRLLDAKAAEDWLDPSFTLPRTSPQTVFDIDKQLGRAQPDDVLMYIRLNTTRWRVDDYEAMSWQQILESSLASGRLPLLRSTDGGYIGVDTATPRGANGHVIRWKGDEQVALSFGTWEAFFEDCVAKLEAGMVEKDPLRISVRLG